VDLVNNWKKDTRQMLREELATNGANSKSDMPLPPLPPDDELSQSQMLQSILTEIRALAPCGAALDRMAIAQEELSEIVRGQLVVERTTSGNSRKNESPPPNESTQALQPLLAELTSAFGEMQQAMKGSKALVEEVRQKHVQSEREKLRAKRSPGKSPEQDNMDFLMQDLQQIKDMLARSSGTETLLAAEVQQLKERLHEVQQKSQKDSETIVKSVEKLADVMSATATTQQDESLAASDKHNQRILDSVQHLAELVSIDHGKTRDEASVVRQSVGLLELEMKLSKDSMNTSFRQSNQELIERLRILEESVMSSHQEAEQKTAARLDMAHGSQVEHMERKAELHSNAVGDLKQEVLLLKDQITSCHEKLEKAPKQLALTEAVRRTFEKLTKEFHEECAQLYMKPSFQVSFPETFNQDLREIKDAIAEEKRGREETQVSSIAELGRLEQEIQRTEQGVQCLETTVKGQLVPELQHLQDIFAMLEGNFLVTVRKQLDKATAAFSSTTAHFKTSLKKDLEMTLKEVKEAPKAQAALPGPQAMAGMDDGQVSHGPRIIENALMFLSIVEFALHLTNALVELQNTDRFLLALAALLGPCLFNVVVVLLFVNYLSHELQRWMSSNWSHSQRLMAFAVLRPDWLRFFGLLVPQLHSSCGAWERRYWQQVLDTKSGQLQQECDELRLFLHSEESPRHHASGGVQDVEMQHPSVPIHSEAVHGALDPDGPGQLDGVCPDGRAEGSAALGLEESQAAMELVQHMQRHQSSPSPASPSPRGPKPVLRNREWDDWLRSQGLEKAQADEGANSQAKALFRPSGAKKVYKWKPEAVARAQGMISVARPLAKPQQLPHGCLLCGMSPDAEKPAVSVYRKFICFVSLASALYNDVPKVVLSIWLLSLSENGVELVILRAAILVICGMYILWALLNALILQLEQSCGWRLPNRASPPIDTCVEDAMVEVSTNSLTVSWSYPSIASLEAKPQDFVCTVEPLGQSEPSILRRVSAEDQGPHCTFGALQADTEYVVKLAASHKGVLFGRPIRISCRTLPLPMTVEPESLSLRSCGPSWAEIAWSGAFTEQLVELRQHGVAGTLLRREVAGPQPVHCLWGLRPNTEYEVGLKLPGDVNEPSLRLSFVTELEEDEPEMNVLGSLTTLLKDLSNVKEMVSSLDAAAASAELTRQLGGLQDRWASLQVSCLTSEIQKLMDSNHQLKSDISDEMKPVFAELQRINEALIAM